jgi:hypothetical protein
VPRIAGRTPLATKADADSSFGLFALDAEGLERIEVSGANATTAGTYTLQAFVGGDINSDGRVDGLDAQQAIAALGKTAGEPAFVMAADADRSGRIDSADVQILGSNFGFQANQPPLSTSGSVLTHVDLEVVVDPRSFVADPEDDAIFHRIQNVQNGIARLSGAGETVLFMPAVNFAGQGSFDVVADDGFASSAPSQVTINVSAAPLEQLKILSRKPFLAIGEEVPMLVAGDFADQQDVLLPARSSRSSLAPQRLCWSTSRPASRSESGSSVIVFRGRNPRGNHCSGFAVRRGRGQWRTGRGGSRHRPARPGVLLLKTGESLHRTSNRRVQWTVKSQRPTKGRLISPATGSNSSKRRRLATASGRRNRIDHFQRHWRDGRACQGGSSECQPATLGVEGGSWPRRMERL